MTDDIKEFLFACEEARIQFSSHFWGKHFNAMERVECENILIMYDQLTDRLSAMQQAREDATAELRAELERMKGFVDGVDDKLYLFLLNGLKDCKTVHGEIVKSIKMGNSVVLTFKDATKYRVIFTRGGVEEVCLDDKNL